VETTVICILACEEVLMMEAELGVTEEEAVTSQNTAPDMSLYVR